MLGYPHFLDDVDEDGVEPLAQPGDARIVSGICRHYAVAKRRIVRERLVFFLKTKFAF